MNKKVVAVFFGGKSFEHDVSILTGLQAIQVMDITKYQPMPVYVDIDGKWWTGKQLLNMKNYPINGELKKQLTQITISVGNPTTSPKFEVVNKKLFQNKYIDFDIAFFAFHGNVGENGPMQGVMEVANIPYTGADVLSSAVYMSKTETKSICRALGINVLNEVIVKKPAIFENFDIQKLTSNIDIKFPVFVKPANLGSSIGVSKASNTEELQAAILSVFRLDDEVIIEPFVENLKEYNVAVMKNLDGEIITSVIETPVNKNDFLDFKDKYLADGGAKKTGPVKLAVPSEGLLSMGREFAPDIPNDMQNFIKESAKKLFSYMGATGNPRIDFLCNSKTGELWLNEVNPIPGSFAFYLWEKSKQRINYSKLVDIIIQNGFKNFERKNKQVDLKSSASVIFKNLNK